MKKIKIIGLIVLVLVCIMVAFGSCKKTKALENGFIDYSFNISELDLEKSGAVIVYQFGGRNNDGISDFLVFENTSTLYVAYSYDNNYFKIDYHGELDLINVPFSNTSSFTFIIKYDTDSLYLYIYKMNYELQYMPGVRPIINNITMIALYQHDIGQYPDIMSAWSGQNGLNIHLQTTAQRWQANYLVNFAYLDYQESFLDISSWAKKQINNNIAANIAVSDSYDYGYDDGYTEGEDAGYDVGYDAGKDDGYDIGYNVGLDDGYELGEQSTDAYDNGYQVGFQAGVETQEAYDIGYNDGQAGNTAITPIFNTLSGIFAVVGSVMSIELVPHVPIGLFVLVPLFFAVIGLVLWIWRKD